MKVNASIRAAGLVIALLAPFAAAQAQVGGLSLGGGGSGGLSAGGSGSLGGALGSAAGALKGGGQSSSAGGLAGALSGGGSTSGSGSSLSGVSSLVGGATGGAGGIAGVGGATSLLSGSSQSNVAGLLEFCVKNNYLSGASGAASINQSVMGKLGGGASSDSGYQSGASGILQGSGGQSLNLSAGGGVKQAVTKQVCNKVLSQAKSSIL